MALRFTLSAIAVALSAAMPMVASSADSTITTSNYSDLNSQLQSGDVTYSVESGNGLSASSGSISLDGNGHSLTLSAPGDGANITVSAEVSFKNFSKLTITSTATTPYALNLNTSGKVTFGSSESLLPNLSFVGEVQSQKPTVDIYASNVQIDGKLTGGFHFHGLDNLTATKIYSGTWSNNNNADVIIEGGTVNTGILEASIDDIVLGSENSAIDGLYGVEGLNSQTGAAIRATNGGAISGWVENIHASSIALDGNGGTVFFHKLSSVDNQSCPTKLRNVLILQEIEL